MQRFINNWSAVLAAPATASAASISVSPLMAAKLVGLGAGGYYLVTLSAVDVGGVETAHEVVKVTAVAGGLLTVERAQEGTLAADWPAASDVSARVTKGTLERLRDVSTGYVASAVVNFSGQKMLGLGDVNTFAVSQDVTAQAVMVPSQADVAWGEGAEIRLQQGAAGPLSVEGSIGVTINHEPDSAPTAYSQYSVMTLKRTGYDTWALFGSLTYSGSPGGPQ